MSNNGFLLKFGLKVIDQGNCVTNRRGHCKKIHILYHYRIFETYDREEFSTLGITHANSCTIVTVVQSH